MKWHRLVLALFVCAFAPAGLAQDSIVSLEPPPPPPAPCGGETITIARLQWPSAELLAAIHARLIELSFGCTVEVVPGDLAATASSMGASGQPAVAPELWITRVADIWNGALKGQLVRQAGTSYAEPVFEGWFVPDYEAAAHPEVLTIEGLKARAADFATSGGGRPRFISCPPDWGCAVVNRNLMRANGLAGLYDIVEPANRFELDTLIAEAVSRKEPVLFYYWQPNAVLAQFAFDLGVLDGQALRQGQVPLSRPARLRQPRAVGLRARPGDRGAGAMGLSRGARGRRLSAARPYALRRNERAFAEPQPARRHGRRRRRRVRRRPRRRLAALGGRGRRMSGLTQLQEA